MNCYFLSDIPAHLKINGEYFGLINNNLSIVDNLSEDCFFEFLPTLSGYSHAYGCKSNKSLRVFKVDSNKLVVPVFERLQVLPFKFIMQKSESYHGETLTVTAYQDGGVKFFLDGIINDIKSIPFSPTNIEIRFYYNYVFVSFSLEKIALFIYDLTSKRLVFSDVIDSFLIDGDLIVKKSYQTVTSTQIIRVYNLNGEFSHISQRDEKLVDFEFLHPYLLPIGFFENVIIGGNVQKITTKNLHDKILDFKEFLGKVIKVIRPPFDSERFYLIKNDCISVCTLQYEDRLISNCLVDDFY